MPFLLLQFGTSILHAFPADDKNSVHTIRGHSVNVFADHSGTDIFYYVPPELRLMHSQVNGVELPDMRFYGTVTNNVYRGVVQLHVTAALNTADYEALEKSVADKYYRSVGTFKLVPVGPISDCRVGLMLLHSQDGGDPKVVGLTEAKSMAEAGTKPAPDAGATTAASTISYPSSVGPTHLSQSFWIQFESTGLNTEIYQTLLNGETGGVLAFLAGTYNAATPEYGVEAELRVAEAASFFRQLEQRTSGWKIGPFGRKKSSVSEVVRHSFDSENYLTVTWLQGGENPEKWEAVEQALWNFILREVCDKRDAKPGEALPLGDLPSMELPSQKFSMFGVSFASPAIGLSWGRASSASVFDFKANLSGTRKFVYRGRFVRPLPMPIWGALNVGAIDPELRKNLFIDVADSRSRISVIPPRPSSTEEGKAYIGAEIKISVPEGQNSQVAYSFTFNEVLNRFVYNGSDGAFVPIDAGFERKPGTRTLAADRFHATLVVPCQAGLRHRAGTMPPPLSVRVPEVEDEATFDSSIPQTHQLRFDSRNPITLYTFFLNDDWPADAVVTVYGRMRGVSGKLVLGELNIAEVRKNKPVFVPLTGLELTEVTARFRGIDHRLQKRSLNATQLADVADHIGGTSGIGLCPEDFYSGEELQKLMPGKQPRPHDVEAQPQ